MGADYPIMLDLRGVCCVVIGGGLIAERKIRGLLESGGDTITVVSPRVTEGIADLAHQGSIRLLLREYIEEDLHAARLVFAATDQSSVNEHVSSFCRKQGVFVNMAGEAGQGDFIVPSVVRRGALVLAVSTSGASPSMASLIRRQLEHRYDDRYAAWLERLGRLRAYVQAVIPDRHERQELLRQAANEIEEVVEQTNMNELPDEDLDQWIGRLRIAASRRRNG